MKFLRPLILTLAIAGAFFYFTTWRSNSQGGGVHSSNWLSHPTQVEITEAAPGETLDGEEQNNISVYRKNIPSVVNVTSRAMTFDFFYGLVPQEGQGSGFVIDKEGHILTNYHVIADARQVEVTLHNRKKYKATVAGTDPAHDLAVIQIKAPELIPLRAGRFAQLAGRAKGLCHWQSVWPGWNDDARHCQFDPPSARAEWRNHRRCHSDRRRDQSRQLRRAAHELAWRSDRHQHHDYCRTRIQSAGIGFAIPINTAKAVLNDLMTLGRVRRPALGVHTIPISPELADELTLPVDYGLLIVQVTPGGSADTAGLRGGTERAYLGNIPIMLGGDLIIAIDGEKVQDEQDLSQMMDNHRAGDTVKVTIYRNKKKMDVSVALGEARQQV